MYHLKKLLTKLQKTKRNHSYKSSARKSALRLSQRRRVLALESLEDRALLATLYLVDVVGSAFVEAHATTTPSSPVAPITFSSKDSIQFTSGDRSAVSVTIPYSIGVGAQNSYNPAKTFSPSALAAIPSLYEVTASATASVNYTCEYLIVGDSGEQIGDWVRVHVEVGADNQGGGTFNYTVSGAATGPGDFWAKIGESITVSAQVEASVHGTAGPYIATTLVGMTSAGWVDLSVLSVRPDAVANSLEWRPSADGGGVDFAYSILNVDLPQAATVSFFWTDSPNATSGAVAAPPQMIVKAQGNHEIFVSSTDFTVPPPSAKYFAAVVDPSNQIKESSESNNNTSFLAIQQPTVELFFDPAGPEEKNDYDVMVRIKNNSIIAHEFGIAVSHTPPLDIPPGWTHTVTPRSASRTVPPKQTETVWVQTIRDDWDWIPPTNPLADKVLQPYVELVEDFTVENSLDILKRGLGEIVGKLLIVKNVINALNDFETSVPTYPALQLRYDALVTAGNGIGDGARSDITVNVPYIRQAKFISYEQHRLFSTIEIDFGLGAMIAAFIPTNPVLFAFGGAAALVGLQDLILAIDFYNQAKDPPDPNFTELVSPTVLNVSLPNELSVEVVREFISYSREFSALQKAEVVSRDRADGARLADEPFWESQQLVASATFATAAAARGTRLISAQSLTQEFVRNNFPGVTQQVLVTLQTDGFPNSIVQFLSEMGWSPVQIESLRARMIAQGPLAFSDVDFNINSRLSVITSAISAIEDFKKASRIRVNQLGATVRDLTWNERQTLNDSRTLIHLGLSQKIPSNSLVNTIEAFIGEVRRLILDTNNYDALEADLADAFSSLITFQQLDPSIAGLQAYVTAQQTVGKIPPVVAGLLYSDLLVAQTQLEAGDFREVSSALVRFLSTVVTHEGLGIDSQTSEQLKGFGNYVLFATAGFDDTNTPPTAVNLQNAVSTLPENAATPADIKLADIVVIDDLLGTNTLTVSGADAAQFKIVGNELFLKEGTLLDYETKLIYSIMIEVDDTAVGTYPDATVAYNLIVTDANSSPVADAGLPYIVAEGGSVVLSGVGSSDPDQAADTLIYQWDLDNDGIYGESGVAALHGDETGVIPTFLAGALDGPSNWSIRLKVTDNGNLSHIHSSTIAISNVEPVIGLITGPTTAVPGQNVDYTVAFSDVGIFDSHAVTINWGDGNITAGSVTETIGTGVGIAMGKHTYASHGAYTITFTIADDDQGVVAKSTSLLAYQSIFVLHTTAAGAFTASGNGTINVEGSVVVSSNSSNAITASGNVRLTASNFNVVGGIKATGNAQVIGPVTHTSVPDPLAGLATPALGNVQAAVSVSGNSSRTINPGTYSSISVSGNGHLTLNPGAYIVAGGGFSVSGNGRITGTGVSIINSASATGSTGSISLSGNGVVTLTPAISGPLTGILILQPSNNTQALTLSGNASADMRGTIYAPKAQLNVTGNGNFTHTIVVDRLILTGNGSNLAAAATASPAVTSNSSFVYTLLTTGEERFGLTTYDPPKLTNNGYISEIKGRDQLFASLATVPPKPGMRSSIISGTPDSDKEDLLDEDLIEAIAFLHFVGR